jgi:cyanate lyase
MIDKELAIRLRKDGFSYNQIAGRIGCSKAWCAIHLKGVQRGESEAKRTSEEVRQETVRILEDALLEIKALY